jgi:tRNA (cmo5U34)-methyltransferase
MRETPSIKAYDLPQRVCSYDADMEIMHPNRSKMVAIALELLPFPGSARLNALDLGIGTGYFTLRFLERYPEAKVLAIDGAEAMIDLARQRLGDRSERVVFNIGDFREIEELIPQGVRLDVVYSSYALHHLSRQDKVSVIHQAMERIRPGGWFVNGDLIAAADPFVESRIQEIRMAGIVSRASGQHERFRDIASTRQTLDELEAKESDQPLTLQEDLNVLREAGLRNPAVFWVEYREAVTGGVKGGSAESEISSG